MKIVRGITIVISSLFILLILLIWVSSLAETGYHYNNAGSDALFSLSALLFYASILGIPYYYRKSKYIKRITGIAFLLSILPLVGIIWLLFFGKLSGC